jgi:nucleolar protein 58
VTDVTPADERAMSLGLAHSLSRFKLKFSPDKIDTMIVQAISLLDDLDKEINIYAMRVREWYGWHFPELSGRRQRQHGVRARRQAHGRAPQRARDRL